MLCVSAPLRSAPPSVFRTLFQVPYPATPLFATLTKTAGVCTNNSHSGTCYPTGVTTSLSPYLLTSLPHYVLTSRPSLFRQTTAARFPARWLLSSPTPCQ